MKTITETPIKFMGLGEKVDDFDVFHPDRMASRILGMGDVVSLVEKAQETIDEEEAERMAEKMRKAEFNLDDFLKQMQQVKKMGSLGSIVSMLPGASGIEIGDEEEKKMARTEAIILSMTRQEREQPRLLKGSRLKRVASGSGVQVREVNALLKQFNQMQKMMKMMRGGKGRKMMKAMKAQMDENGGIPGMPGM
jgi:signal recognition particle subunit SRP54